ncbi:MAG: hypothetical protein CMG59_02845 [Candidatus Marinimicrobia bacterium]|nr:hypothetical protein [Candidatus Neomarinimicrobiota bacterium]
MIDSASSKDFQLLYRASKLVTTNTIHYRISKNERYCIGFIIPRSLGPAFKRNLFKRRLRSLCCKFIRNQNIKFSLIITPKTINLTWCQILNSFELVKNELHNV